MCPKAEGSCGAIAITCHPSVNFYLICFSQTTGPFLTKFGVHYNLSGPLFIMAALQSKEVK